MSYVVRSGDTLGAIASRNGTTVQAIMAANPQIKNPNMISVGQQLNLPGGGGGAIPSAPSAPSIPAPSSYTVRSGDTLGAIANRNGTTVNEIMAANPQIRNPNQISPGQKINLPGGSNGGGAPQPQRPPQQQPPTQQQPAPAQQGGSSLGTPPATGPWELPDVGPARRLAAGDFEAAARELQCETAAVRAVAEVESGGRTGFDDNRRPKILFEIHHFKRLTGGRYDRSHPHLSAPYSSPNRRASYKKNQWTVIREAFALDPDAAVKSASWGMFQVMGFNHADVGWSNVRQFVYDMYESEAQHMRAFLGFCRTNNLVRHIRSKNWASFARGYNGPDYASNAYHTKMANAYARYSRG
ncbi:N-acetylmuramidase domain-containing protein [Polyangium spumosum]|uniref:N-acetylmuramidase domain-containing protein n=1 Tax=Polyangium spumosum TaxID=889282 RepID=UPI0014795A47|nr:N-acetylmuramidase domain-containing protein [Polyangium spumosum]